ncbi:cation diffusion facilitator family transporter [Roseateles koreensis]|uniref:Cation diffusion facilitator family transporter n=1 Tax=Roseateles koreensis TaxID=2987526 RepID=A0ABT5KP81_9BURK|nr:cation diffusion facilitator family transporter [Roseateles koreensis]MDC8784723.1 cation diffusion facilitator family transporter [Roseateles koreensis]
MTASHSLHANDHANAGHSHGHGHGHGHHHHGDPANHGRAFLVAIVLNSLFVVLEFGYGFVANSTALMADAGHNLSDVLGLLMAWMATLLARKTPSERYTYGLRSTSILAALGNAVLLFVACGAIALEAVQRFSSPPPVAGMTVILVAAAGIVVNGFSAWLFMRGSKDDLNIRGAYLHMAADAAVSLGVVLAGAAILYTGWNWLDAALSLVIVAVILWGTWGLLREAVHLALDAVPAHIDAAAVLAYLAEQPGVRDVHDLHIWGMSTTETALTAHLVMPAGYPGDGPIDAIAQGLRQRFSILHSTLQVELGEIAHPTCALHPGAVPGKVARQDSDHDHDHDHDHGHKHGPACDHGHGH